MCIRQEQDQKKLHFNHYSQIPTIENKPAILPKWFDELSKPLGLLLFPLFDKRKRKIFQPKDDYLPYFITKAPFLLRCENLLGVMVSSKNGGSIIYGQNLYFMSQIRILQSPGKKSNYTVHLNQESYASRIEKKLRQI